MAQEIGVAYVSLLPSGRGFSKGVQSEAESAFKGAEKTSDGFFKSVTKWAKRGALVVGGMVASVGALAIGGGISRALNIEDATAKLRGLGHNTQAVEAIMQDALASVKGTAFGLDAAATTAASAVAAGIKPGQELERYLRLTADAATIAGTSMSEMGDIINQVTSKGYAGMENLNRLTERGIPIMQWLQKEYGVTADELAKMVSRGEVDAATFRKAIEDNIGGAALESGNTTRGAFANMLASLSRLGEGFAGPALGAARDFFNEVTKITDAIKSTLTPAFSDLQYWVDGLDFKFSDKVIAFLTPLLEIINDLSAAARDRSLSTWFRDAAKASPVVSVLLGVATAVAPLIPLFKALGETVGPVLAATFGQILAAVEPLIPVLAGTLADAIVDLAPSVTELVVALLPLLPPLVDLATMVLPLVVELLKILVPIVAGVVDVLADWLNGAMAFQSFINGDTSFEQWGQSILQLGDVMRTIWTVFVVVTTGIAGALSFLSNVWNAGWASIVSILGNAWKNIQATVSSLWMALPQQFRTGVESVVGFLATLPGRIGQVMSGVGSWLVGSGRALIQGFIDGITSMIGRVSAAVGGIMDFVGGFFPHSPAKRGPFSGAGWTAVADGGASLMEQFTVGAERFNARVSFAGIEASLQGVSVPDWSGPEELVIRDVNDELVGRMRVEADAASTNRGAVVTSGIRNRRRADA